MRPGSAAWFNAQTMNDRYEIVRALGATALLAAIFLFFVFAAPRDPSHIVAGARCSVLSENEIGLAVGAPVRLMPTSGGICEYVSTGNGPQRMLFVVAKSDPAPPSGWRASAAAVRGLGSEALHRDASLYVRFGRRAYIVTLVPDESGAAGVYERERNLAAMLGRSTIARSK